MNESISVRSVVHMHGRELSRISDALRTPLTSIVGFAEAILSDPSMEANRRAEFTRIIKAEGERLSKFVDEILYLSFSDPETFEREQTEFAVSFLVDTAIQVASARTERVTLTFSNETPAAPLTVRSDKQFLLTILSNVLNNTARFLAADETIRVRAHCAHSKLHVTVTARRRNVQHPHSIEFLGLARTEYLIALRGGSLRTTTLDSGETCVEVILPVSPIEKTLH